jgi:hypothetical protein
MDSVHVVTPQSNQSRPPGPPGPTTSLFAPIYSTLFFGPSPSSACLENAASEEDDRSEPDHVLEGVLQLPDERPLGVPHLHHQTKHL